MKKSGTKKFVNAPEPFLRLAIVRRGLFAAVFVLRVVPRFCVVIIFSRSALRESALSAIARIKLSINSNPGFTQAF